MCQTTKAPLKPYIAIVYGTVRGIPFVRYAKTLQSIARIERTCRSVEIFPMRKAA